MLGVSSGYSVCENQRPGQPSVGSEGEDLGIPPWTLLAILPVTRAGLDLCPLAGGGGGPLGI